MRAKLLGLGSLQLLWAFQLGIRKTFGRLRNSAFAYLHGTLVSLAINPPRAGPYESGWCNGSGGLGGKISKFPSAARPRWR